AYTFGDSPASNSVQVEIADFQVPQNVLAISIDSSVQVVWEPVQPATHFIHYKVYRDNQEIGTSTHVVFVDEDRPNGSYRYQVSSLYSQGESELSAVSALDHIKAYPPLDMFIEIQRNIATVSWYTPVDTGFLSGFRIYRNGEALY
ncbi:MAG TPA: fibronectin type III domain-containing protein, partial [Candidatus Cloacimonadota bacterium]|nr:fibronectin type III domain-containing protein [Candidatus Cloacimonadota bacterium]